MAVFVNHGEIMPHCSGNTAKTNFGRKECTADVPAEAAQWNSKSSGWVFRAVVLTDHDGQKKFPWFPWFNLIFFLTRFFDFLTFWLSIML